MEDQGNLEYGEITYIFDVRDFDTEEVLAYIDRGFLMVNAMHKNESSESKEEKSLTEKISLPANVDMDSLKVTHERGVLTVKLRRTDTIRQDRQNYERERERERQREREREERRFREREREMERQRERERQSALVTERERERERQRERERESQRQRERSREMERERHYERWS